MGDVEAILETIKRRMSSGMDSSVSMIGCFGFVETDENSRVFIFLGCFWAWFALRICLYNNEDDVWCLVFSDLVDCNVYKSVFIELAEAII